MNAQPIAQFDNCSYCNGTGKVDVEDDWFVTVGYNHERTVRDQLQREVYGHERLINRLHEALMRGDYDSIDGLIRDAYLSLHGPRE